MAPATASRWLAMATGLSLQLANAALAAAAPDQSEKVAQLIAVQALDQRIADIGWRLATGNVDLCPRHTGATGIALHSASQYAPGYRAAAIAAFALGSDGPGIQTVAQGSPAWNAGIRPGDRLLAVGGEGFAAAPEPAPTKRRARRPAKASYAETDAAMARLEALPAGQPILLRIQREGRAIDLTLAPVTACASRFELATGNVLNANSNGKVVQVFGRLALTYDRDEDLALVMAHELAHNALGHNQAIAQQRLPTGSAAAFSGKGAILRDFEREADRYGIYMAARAGYPYAHAPEFWRGLAASAGLGAWIAASHPTPGNRQANAAAVVAEIDRLKRLGAPLVPAEPPAVGRQAE